jgi:phosphoglycerate dehydrogenase-like enzyme
MTSQAGHHIIGAAQLLQMKPGATLFNSGGRRIEHHSHA